MVITNELTYIEYLNHFFKDNPGALSLKTLRSNKNDFYNNSIKFFKDYKLKDFSYSLLLKTKAKEKKENISNTYIYVFHSFTIRVLKCAYEEGFNIDTNIFNCKKEFHKNINNNYIHYSKKEEIEIIKKLNDSGNMLILIAILTTGISIGEAMALKTYNYDRINKTLEINGAFIEGEETDDYIEIQYDINSNQKRKIILSDIANSLLIKAINYDIRRRTMFLNSPVYNPKQYLFLTSDNKPFSREYFWKLLPRLKEKLGISDFSVLGLIHQFRVNCINAGANIASVTKYIGMNSSWPLITSWSHAKEYE